MKAGLSCGVILALGEIAFGVVMYFLRPTLFEFPQVNDYSLLVPVATIQIAFVFLVIAIFFACGMISAKWLAALPIGSAEIAVLGALAGVVSEVVRSVAALPINFGLSYLAPFPGVAPGQVLAVALQNSLVRLFVVLPAFIVVAAVVAGLSAYVFSMIFFRPDNAPK